MNRSFSSGGSTGRMLNLLFLPVRFPTVAIDIDIKNGRNGIDTLEDLGFPFNPTTPTAHTPSGGIHWLFQRPDQPIPTSATAIGAGVEIKGDRGWITLPPGPGRFWDPHLGLDLPLAPFPDSACSGPWRQRRPSPLPGPRSGSKFLVMPRRFSTAPPIASLPHLPASKNSRSIANFSASASLSPPASSLRAWRSTG